MNNIDKISNISKVFLIYTKQKVQNLIYNSVNIYFDLEFK